MGAPDRRHGGAVTTLDGFFAEFPESRVLYERLAACISACGDGEVRITKSQIAFVRRTAFAWAWIPDRYLRGGHAPLVVSVALPHRDNSARWKEVVELSPDHFMHHLEVWSEADIDEFARPRLAEAWRAAG